MSASAKARAALYIFPWWNIHSFSEQFKQIITIQADLGCSWEENVSFLSVHSCPTGDIIYSSKELCESIECRVVARFSQHSLFAMPATTIWIWRGKEHGLVKEYKGKGEVQHTRQWTVCCAFTKTHQKMKTSIFWRLLRWRVCDTVNENISGTAGIERTTVWLQTPDVGKADE